MNNTPVLQQNKKAVYNVFYKYNETFFLMKNNLTVKKKKKKCRMGLDFIQSRKSRLNMSLINQCQ